MPAVCVTVTESVLSLACSVTDSAAVSVTLKVTWPLASVRPPTVRRCARSTRQYRPR